MPNIELLEKSTPVAPIRIAALAGCQDLAKEVDKKLVKFRRELVAKKKPMENSGNLKSRKNTMRIWGLSLKTA